VPPFNWKQYLALAISWETQPAEGFKRSAISRAYYSAFNTARLRLVADGMSKGPGKGSHQKIWNAYRLDPDPRRNQIGVDGNRLKSRRVKADYHDTMSNPAREAARAVAEARQLVADIDNL
jgi:uncharacterized protein (UPF0332 family)